MFVLSQTKYRVEIRNGGHPHMIDNLVSGNRSEKYLAASYTNLNAQWLTASYDPSKCKQPLKLPFVLRILPLAFL